MSRADPVPPFDLSIQMTFNLNIEIKYQAHNASLQDFARLRDNSVQYFVRNSVRQSLMLVLPNFLHSTLLQAAGVAVPVLKLAFVALAQRATWAVVTVWMTAPLLIQLANVFSVVGVGRPCFAGPRVWLYKVLYEVILFENSLLQFFQAVGTLPVAPVFPYFLLFVRPPVGLVRPQFVLPDRPAKAEEVPEVVRVREPLRPLTLVAIVSISKRYIVIVVAFPTFA